MGFARALFLKQVSDLKLKVATNLAGANVMNWGPNNHFSGCELVRLHIIGA